MIRSFITKFLCGTLVWTGAVSADFELSGHRFFQEQDCLLVFAMLLIEYREDQDSWRRARELVTPLRNAAQPAYLDTVGWVEYRLGENEQAVLFLEKAVDAAPNAAIMRYHLGMAYLAQGNEVEARDHLSKAVESNVEFKGLEEARDALDRLGAG